MQITATVQSGFYHNTENEKNIGGGAGLTYYEFKRRII